MSENSFVFDKDQDLWRAFDDKTINSPMGQVSPVIIIKRIDGVWCSWVIVLGQKEMGRLHKSFEAAKAYYGR